MLTFEHLIQINDPLMPLLTPLTREEVWRGLQMRAHLPTEFVLGLEDCRIASQSADGPRTVLERVLDYGAFVVHDSVTLTPMEQVSTVAQPGPGWPRSTATVTIEEPEPGILFLRFAYHLELARDSDERDPQSVELRKQAYLAADMDTVQRIRELADGGRLPH